MTDLAPEYRCQAGMFGYQCRSGRGHAGPHSAGYPGPTWHDDPTHDPGARTVHPGSAHPYGVPLTPPVGSECCQ